ncbi:MAG: hypothetical protein KHZ68_07290 [Rothia mucilaginosa]|uniref:hypothetical protein n=1 Tax=Rothia mucilaginosa TaxID=43675 RepID=UPI0026EA0081|nr:hypothetical protein [Rothia mucilaginosa]MBS4941452.1 hypothetical protein [Rothia mucilaginosa]
MSTNHGTEEKSNSAWRLLINFLLYVSPVALLTTIFPIVTPTINRYNLDGVPLIQVILAASITVPWLSQAACLPLYRAIQMEHKKIEDARQGLRIHAETLEHQLKRAEARAVRARMSEPQFQDITDLTAFTRNWLYLFFMTMPLVLLFAIPVALVLHWSPTAFGAFFVLGVLNIAFAQLLVIPNLAKNRIIWFIAWLGYSLALLCYPVIWFLPPLVGSLILLVSLGKDLVHLLHFARIPLKDIALDALRGFFTGSIIWADKYMLFLVTGGEINVVAIYLSLIPCVIAYNYFFVVEADRVNASIQHLWTIFDRLPYKGVQAESSKALGILMFIFLPQSYPLALSGLVVAFLFVAVALLIYQIEYMTMYVTVQLLSAAHLVLLFISFMILPNETGYLPIIVGEAVLAFACYRVYRQAWAAPEYSLFWRRALAW